VRTHQRIRIKHQWRAFRAVRKLKIRGTSLPIFARGPIVVGRPALGIKRRWSGRPLSRVRMGWSAALRTHARTGVHCEYARLALRSG